MLESSDLETREIKLSSQRKTKVLINLRDSGADLHLCFSHMQKGGLRTGLIFLTNLYLILIANLKGF